MVASNGGTSVWIVYPNQSESRFGYNAFGARVSRVDSSGMYRYWRSGVSVVSPVLSDGVAEYTPGISERRGGVSTFYHADLKSGVAQTGSSGSVSGRRAYDAFGNVVGSTGTWQGPFSYGGPFGYQTDGDSVLLLLGHRYYDPTLGRFLSRDPIGDGRNCRGGAGL
jgi:RHS repeat-associated protein